MPQKILQSEYLDRNYFDLVGDYPIPEYLITLF